MVDLKYLASLTSKTPKMQQYYLACIDEFGEDFKGFIEELCKEAKDMGWDDAHSLYEY